MKELGVRDIIGPVMIGPSSSHTAGALAIASMCRRLLSGEPKKATFTLYGSFAHTYHGHGTDRALLAGLMGMPSDDHRIRESFQIAQEAGLEYHFEPDTRTRTRHSNTVDIEVLDESGSITTMRGESIGGGAAVVTRINGVDVNVTGEYHNLVIRQLDRKGVLAHIFTCLSVYGVNAATAHSYRESKGEEAYTIVETDEHIPQGVVTAILDNPNIKDVRIVDADKPNEDTEAALAAKPGGFGEDLSPEQAEELFQTINFANGEELLAYCESEGLPISDAICRRERSLLAANGVAVDDTRNYLYYVLDTMRQSALEPLRNPQPSMGGLIGGESQGLAQMEATGVLDPLMAKATTYAMAVLETNACMGRIVAAPTAGSAGVLPAVLLAMQDVHGFTDQQLHRGLANAAAIGYIITRNATVSGAEGGCQAEIGAASAMAASAAVELMGGTPRQCLAAASNALAGLMGLVCDPIAGLVEAPCQKRNATGAANALVSAQIALSGVQNLVDFDQTVEAMRRVGCSLPFELRESALGGLAATPAACKFCEGCAQ